VLPVLLPLLPLLLLWTLTFITLSPRLPCSWRTAGAGSSSSC
jgi:hypothetical protein